MYPYSENLYHSAFHFENAFISTEALKNIAQWPPPLLDDYLPPYEVIPRARSPPSLFRFAGINANRIETEDRTCQNNII